MPLLRSFMPDVFGLSGRSPPAAACSRSLRAAFCACFLMSFLSRAVCRGGPLADAGAGEDGFCELNLSLMVGLGRVSGRGSPFLSGCELEGSEASDLTDSEESLWVSNLARISSELTSPDCCRDDGLRSRFLLGPSLPGYSSSLSGSRSTLELSCADERLLFSSAPMSLSTAASILPLHSSRVRLMVGLSARNGREDETTSTIQGST